jgi:hypothetical protein
MHGCSNDQGIKTKTWVPKVVPLFKMGRPKIFLNNELAHISGKYT